LEGRQKLHAAERRQRRKKKVLSDLDLGLEVMEINPQTLLKTEIESWSKLAKDAGFEIAQEVGM
jgi:hypothetical protein